MAEFEKLPVAQARAGEAEAWDALFRRYQLPLYVYVFELVGNEQTSLDIVQESFISAARHLGSLREDNKFGGWLFGIAHQKCVQCWRRGRAAQVLLERLSNALFDCTPAPDELLIQEEQEAAFMEHLNQLPPAHRSVLLLHYLEDFSLEDIAQITGTSVGTVKSRLHYARKAIRKLIENHNARS